MREYPHSLIYPFGEPLCEKCGMPAPWINENACFLARVPGGNPRAERRALRRFEAGR